jgi:3',5'-nucleoside bisphosphate phosphatase
LDSALIKYADLHVHTTMSDGSYTPSEIVERASRLGVAALGIADHDTMKGIPLARSAAVLCGLEVVPAVEINTDYMGAEVHVLAYYPAESDGPFTELLTMMRDSREERLIAMVERLDGLGLHIDPERVKQLAGDAAPSRPHVALALHESGHVATLGEAFSKYLTAGKPAYVERYHLSPKETVRAILDAGGVPVLAHPGLTGHPELLSDLADVGLMGVEVYHPDHDRGMELDLLRFTMDRGLLITGGSDCHGPRYAHSGDIGDIRLPYEHFLALRDAAERQHAAYGRRGGEHGH